MKLHILKFWQKSDIINTIGIESGNIEKKEGMQSGGNIMNKPVISGTVKRSQKDCSLSVPFLITTKKEEIL